MCTDFGPCSANCGGGIQTCDNVCQNGVFGETGCPEESRTSEQACNPQACFTMSECRAWGDPHVITFDGANNDVYGVATYVLAQSTDAVAAESKV